VDLTYHATTVVAPAGGVPDDCQRNHKAEHSAAERSRHAAFPAQGHRKGKQAQDHEGQPEDEGAAEGLAIARARRLRRHDQGQHDVTDAHGKQIDGDRRRAGAESAEASRRLCCPGVRLRRRDRTSAADERTADEQAEQEAGGQSQAQVHALAAPHGGRERGQRRPAQCRPEEPPPRKATSAAAALDCRHDQAGGREPDDRAHAEVLRSDDVGEDGGREKASDKTDHRAQNRDGSESSKPHVKAASDDAMGQSTHPTPSAIATETPLSMSAAATTIVDRDSMVRLLWVPLLVAAFKLSRVAAKRLPWPSLRIRCGPRHA